MLVPKDQYLLRMSTKVIGMVNMFRSKSEIARLAMKTLRVLSNAWGGKTRLVSIKSQPK